MKQYNATTHISSFAKKTLSLLLAGMLVTALFTGCGAPAASSAANSAASSLGAASATSPAANPKGKAVSIGLIQLVQHTSLDEISTAIQTQLQSAAAAQGLAVTVDYQNAQGDMSTINTICQQFVANEVDLVIAIATPAAQGAVSAVTGTDIPVIFSAVTDPVAAQLVENLQAPESNVTGTSDAISVQKIFELAAQLTPDVKSFGLMYNTGEVNSVAVIDEVKTYLESKGLSYTEGAVTQTADVQIAAQNLLGKCDALFIPIDNTVAAGMTIVAQEAIKAKKPVYVAADSLVRDGGLASVGVNYTNLGIQTANMALKVLGGTPVKDIPVEVMKEARVVVNAETAAAIGVDVKKYETEAK